MAAQRIEIAGCDYEHVLAISANDGPFAYRLTAAPALSGIVLGGAPFDVTEYSLANHIMLHASGARKLPAIPVFPSRAFRNSAIFVAKDSALASPAELAGKRIGVSEFAMTAAVWARGHLHDDHGLDWRAAHWVTSPDQRFALPPGIAASTSDANLEDLLAAGAIDALVTGKPKDALRPPAERRLRCLIADPAAQERGYFERTGIFPIMHTLVLHEHLAGDEPVARALFDAYVAARRSAIKRRLSAGFLPFVERDWEVLAHPGGDPTRYGLTDANRRAVATLSRYLREQGLIDHEPAIEDLFVAGSADWIDG
jgi:4,5-dihydroxyphthalate decarboxylase